MNNTRTFLYWTRLVATLIVCLLASAKAQSNEVSSGKDVEQNISRPVVTNTTFEHIEVDPTFYQSPYQVSLFNPKHGENGDRVWSQTKSIFGLGLGVIGVLWLMPEDFTNWDKDGDLFGKWPDNVKEVAVWDRDVWYINYVGHPYFGGVYYQVARKSGYRQWDSFIYSVMMSTFYWEYGVEAFAERPSLQDLVATPVGGWIYGEWMYNQEMKIRANNNELWDSKGWGKVALFFLDPVDTIGHWINGWTGHNVIKAGTGLINLREIPVGNQGETDRQIYLGVSMALGDGSRNYNSANVPRYTKITNDPVDYSIISIGFSGGYTNLDELWGLEDGPVAGFEIGMHFTKKFSAHLSFSRGHLNEITTGDNIPYENYSINGQYYFNTDSDWRPFLVAGFGEQLRDQDRDLDVFVVHGGAGLYYKINNNWALQADWRAYHSTRFDSTDSLANASVIYRFGKGEWY